MTILIEGRLWDAMLIGDKRMQVLRLWISLT